MDPTAISSKLPHVLRSEQEKYLVVITSSLTSKQRVRTLKRFLCRRSVIAELLQFYVLNNKLYQDLGIEIDTEALDYIEKHGERMSVGVEFVPPTKGRDLFPDKPMKNQEDSQSEEDTEIEDTCVEENFLAMDEAGQTTVEAMELARDTLIVRNYGQLIPDHEKHLFGLAFPDLFPYGRGHPRSKRFVAVSREESIRYYLRLSNRSMVKHPFFILAGFSVCGRQRVAISTVVRCKIRPGEFEKFASVSREDVARVLSRKRNERINKKLRVEEQNDHRKCSTTT